MGYKTRISLRDVPVALNADEMSKYQKIFQGLDTDKTGMFQFLAYFSEALLACAKCKLPKLFFKPDLFILEWSSSLVLLFSIANHQIFHHEIDRLNRRTHLVSIRFYF